MIGLSATEGSVGTRTAAVVIVGGGEGNIGIEDVVDGLLEEFDKTVGVNGDIGDGLSADDERASKLN